MKQFLSFIITLLITFSSLAQEISGKGGAISDNGIEQQFPLTVEGIVPTKENFGLASVQLDIDHSWTSDLDIYLIAPDGFRFKLSLANGGSGQNYKNTIFSANATTDIADADAPFTGTFKPQDNLNYLNKTKNTNGVWKLAITDTYIGNIGILNNWSLRFGTIAAFSAASAPPCGVSAAATEACDSTPLPPVVCKLNGYCGNTSSVFAPPHVWPGLTSAFCGGIQNNSFIRFIAGLSTVTFNVWVYNSTTGGGVQYMVFGGNCGSGAVTSYGCNFQLSPTTGGVTGTPDQITATGLTPGNVYYLMFDGFGGDVCDYTVGATPTSGIVTLTLNTSSPAFCNSGDIITLTANSSGGLTTPTYNWTCTNPAFVPPAGTSTTTITTNLPGTYTVASSGGCGDDTVTIFDYVPLYNTVPAPDLTSYTTFNLTNNNAHILNGQNPADFSIKFYKNQADALSVASNFITNPTTYTISPLGAASEVIWVSVTDNRALGAGCARAFSYTVYRLLPITATNSGPVCAGSTFDLYCNPAPGYTFIWTDALGTVVGNTQNVIGLPTPVGPGPHVYTVTAVGFPLLVPSSTTLVVNPLITPTFTPVPPACDGDVLAPLPTTSLNGITGTWSPALDNTVTTTYTFTPTVGLCATPATLTITITPKTVPTFTPVGPICSGTPISPLQNPSNNGYVGNWSPGLNNTATTTYTFTPTAGQCAAVTTMTIVVNPLPVATISAPTGTCRFDPVSPLVTFTGTVGTAPFTFTYNINGGPIQTVTTLPGNNSVTVSVPTGTLGTFNYNLVRVQDAFCNKFQSATATVKIVSPPTLLATNVNYTICDDDFSGNDGVANFFLHTQDGFFQNPALYTVNYYETLIDAQNAYPGTEISLAGASPYRNLLSSGSQILHVRVVDAVANACPSFGTLTLIVRPLPIPPLLIPDFVKCDNNLPRDVTETFNLHDWDANCGMITGTTTATYYAQDPSITVGNPQLPFLYTNSAISPITTIWVKLTNNVTGCWGKRSFRLIVNPLPSVPKPVPAYTKCDYNNPGNFIETFDLSTQIPNINTTPGIVVTFHNTLAAAIAVGGAQLPNLYNNTSASGNPGVQTIFVRVTDLLTGCFDTSTMDLRVNQLPNPTAPLLPVTICDSDQDGFSTFNLNTLISGISSPATTTVTFYETFTDATTPANVIPNPATYQNVTPFTQTVFARAEDINTRCFKVISIILKVAPAPLAPTTGLLHDLNECDDKDGIIDGFTRFNLTEGGIATSNANVLLAIQSQPASSYNITYHTSLADAQTTGSPQIILTTTYLNTIVNNQTIWIAIEDKITKCRNWGSFQIIVNRPLILSTPPPFRECDDDLLLPPRRPFDLTKQNSIILGTFATTPGYTVTYYNNVANSLLAGTTGLITNPTSYVNVPDTGANNAQTLGVVVRTPDGCKSYTSLTIIVIPIPKPRALVLPAMTLKKCDDINSPNNTELFDLTTNENYIRNADSALIFEYYPTAADAMAVPSTNRYLTPTNQEVGTGTVWIKAMNTQLDWNGERCYALVQQPVIVNPLPAISNQSTAKCIPQTVGGPTIMTGHTFNLTSLNSLVLDSTITTTIPAATTPQVLSNYTFTYSNGSGSIGSPSAYNNTANPEFLTVTVTNTLTGCNTTAIVKLIVELEATSLTPPASITPLKACDTDTSNPDGFYTFNLLAAGGIQEQILGATPVAPYTNYAVNYFYKQPYLTGIPNDPVLTPTTYVNQVEDTDLLWVVVTNTTTTTPCRLIFSIPVTVERFAKPKVTSVDGNDTVCIDFLTNLPLNDVTLDSGLLLPPLPTSPIPHPSTVASNYTFEWYLDTSTTPIPLENGSRITVTKEGNYTVKAISKTTAPLGCQSTISAPFTVKKSGPALIGNPQYFVTNAFSVNQIVTVNFINGHGSYQYRIDNGPWQISNVFENVAISDDGNGHLIEVQDINGCGTIPISNVDIVDFPHFFTPNGDGLNDTWNISGLANQPKAIVYIYDRFGRLIKQISTSDTSNGWDGTFSGKQLPADDYWFTIDFMEETSNRIFKSHFTLKR